MLFFSTQTQSRTVKQSKIQIFKQFFPLALDPTTLLLYSCINPYCSEKCFFRLVMRQRGTKKILSMIVNLNQESFLGSLDLHTIIPLLNSAVEERLFIKPKALPAVEKKFITPTPR